MTARTIFSDVPSSSSSSSPTPTHQDELARICDLMIVSRSGSREIAIDPREQLAEDEAREMTAREEGVRTRKRRLHTMIDDDDEESTSEKEDERRRELRDLDREIESLGDSVRMPEAVPMDEMQSCSPEPPDFEIAEPPPDASRSAMWEPTFEERGMSLQDRHERQRSNFMLIYPGRLDQRHAVVQALLDSVGTRPSLGAREQVDLARNSLTLHTRKTDDDLLRTPKTGERQCRNDAECELYKYHGKIARECLNPEELQVLERSGQLPSERRPCLGCMRYNVTWFWMLMRRKGVHAGASFISSHYNLVSMRGEYDPEQCLISSNFGLPLPVVPFAPGGFSLREEIMDDEPITRFVQIGMVVLDANSGFP